MASRLLAGCLSFLLLVAAVGAGVLYFLQYQQRITVTALHEKALKLYNQDGLPPETPPDPDRQAEAISIWRQEVIPRAGNQPFVPAALLTVGEWVYQTSPDEARPYYERLANQFPDSPEAQTAQVRLAEFNLTENPEMAEELYSQVLATTGTSSLQADAQLGLIQLEDNPDEFPPPEVRRQYQDLIRAHPESEAARKARARLDEVNRHLIFTDLSPNEFKEVYIIQRGDVLLKIANKYLTTVYMLERLNSIRAESIQPNQQILVPSWGKVYAVVDKSDYQLMVYREEDNSFLIQYLVGIGEMEWKTKAGEYLITNKQIHPPWRGLKFGDPEYPLGERWLGLSPPGNPTARTGLGIHGTNEPESIGKSASAGCVRMYNEDVIEAFAVLRQKSRVIIQE